MNVPSTDRMSKRRVRSFGRADDATVMVEFVMVLPVLLILLFIMIGTGMQLWYHNIVNQGVRDATRYLSRVPIDGTTIAQAQQVALTGTPDGTGTGYAFWSEPNTVAVEQLTTTTNGALSGVDPVVTIRVTATVPVNTPVLRYFGLGAITTIVVADEARHIGE